MFSKEWGGWRLFAPWPSTAILALSLIIAIGWMLLAEQSGDAGRGGAVAVAMSFLMLFTGNSRSQRAFAMLTERIVKLDDDLDTLEGLSEDESYRVERLERRLDDLRDAFRDCNDISADEQKVSNYKLAFVSVVGTIIWGFADKV